MRKYFVVAAMLLYAAPVMAQGIGLGLFGGALPVITVPGSEVSDPAAEASLANIDASTASIDLTTQAILAIEEQNIMPGLAGGFDWSQTLQSDLEQQVSSAGGMPLDIGALGAYPTFWPGYTDANYQQAYDPNSPEGNMATTLGTLQGVLNAAADQQTSQNAEAARTATLEAEISAAQGNLQIQEVNAEINLFNGQEAIKGRNAINGQLNALVVAKSNEQNQKAQDDLESLCVGNCLPAELDLDNYQDQEPTLPGAGFGG